MISPFTNSEMDNTIQEKIFLKIQAIAHHSYQSFELIFCMIINQSSEMQAKRTKQFSFISKLVSKLKIVDVIIKINQLLVYKNKKTP